MYSIYVSIESYSSSTKLPQEEDPPSWLSACLDIKQVQAALQGRPAALTLTYLDHNEALQLNTTYRQREYATNILSFPAEIPSFITSVDDGFTLGDLVICPEVVIREAQQQHKNTAHHFAHLIIHGFLHLLGFDHESQADALVMETIEINALSQLNIANPYSIPSYSIPSHSDTEPHSAQISSSPMETA